MLLEIISLVLILSLIDPKICIVVFSSLFCLLIIRGLRENEQIDVLFLSIILIVCCLLI